MKNTPAHLINKTSCIQPTLISPKDTCDSFQAIPISSQTAPINFEATLSSFTSTPSTVYTTPTGISNSTLYSAKPMQLGAAPLESDNTPPSQSNTSNLYGTWRPPSVWTHEKSTGGFTSPGSYPLNKNGGRLVSPSKTRRKSDKVCSSTSVSPLPYDSDIILI